MGTDAYINIVLQTFGGMVSLMMAIYLLFIRRGKRRLDRLYVQFLAANSLIQCLDVASWYYHGRTGMAVHITVVIVDFLAYAFHYLLLGTLTDYLTAFLEKTKRTARGYPILCGESPLLESHWWWFPNLTGSTIP